MWRTGRTRAAIGVAAAALAVVMVSGQAQAGPGDDRVGAAANPVSEHDVLIEQRLQALLQPALTAAQNSQVRALVGNIVSRQFDGDTNALFATVIQEAEESWLVDPQEPGWVALKDAVAQFQDVNGWAYQPQIYIHAFDEGVVPTDQVVMTVAPADETVTSMTGYVLGPWGDAEPLATPIDEAYASVYEVWVLSVNEPVPGADPPTTAGQVRGPVAASGEAAGTRAGVNGVCNPTGLRNNRGLEYLQQWRGERENLFGEWFEGAREMKLVILSSNGTVIKNAVFPKVKKKHFDEWQFPDMFITTWDQAVWGNVLGYQWFELDSGPDVTFGINIPIPATGGSITANVTIKARDDDGGSTPVMFSESTYTEYTTGSMRFKLCSMGGDGGSGNNNLACASIAAASSTFSGYSPNRVNDCNRDTRLGGDYSWANNSGTYPPNNPEWVQVDFGVNKTFSRVVVYTSQGYPIRDFEVQVWNGVVFTTVGTVLNNTQLSVTVLFPSRTSRLVRVLARSGPTHQPGYVRVNELEVYPV